MKVKQLYLPLFGLIALSSSPAEDLEWQWINGKLVQTAKPIPKTSSEQNKSSIEWKLVNGKLTQVNTEKATKVKTKKEIIDIPDSGTQGIKTIEYKRQRDITSQFQSSEIKQIDEFQTDENSFTKNLTIEDQKIPLPKRFIPGNKKLTNEQLNNWGQNLLLRRDWINHHTKRISSNKNITREFLVYYSSIHKQWKVDVQQYEKALNKATP